jgi:hypothetical protein
MEQKLGAGRGSAAQRTPALSSGFPVTLGLRSLRLWELAFWDTATPAPAHTIHRRPSDPQGKTGPNMVLGQIFQFWLWIKARSLLSVSRKKLCLNQSSLNTKNTNSSAKTASRHRNHVALPVTLKPGAPGC